MGMQSSAGSTVSANALEGSFVPCERDLEKVLVDKSKPLKESCGEFQSLKPFERLGYPFLCFPIPPILIAETIWT
jgi:hypothetical protein